jgi:chloride channel protein, CIC family
MHEGEFQKKAFRFRREHNHHPTTIRFIVLAVYQTMTRQPIHQSYNTVVLEIQTFGQLSNSHLIAGGKALDRQQRLVLLGLVFGYDDELAGHLADRMAATEIGRVPIVNRRSGLLVGLVARRDLLRVRANVVRHEREREALIRLSR